MSNASDALEKARYAALTETSNEEEFVIKIVMDEGEGKVLVVLDNGVGMMWEELMENLGMIARSGSKAFLEGLDADADAASNIIGKFGVGFYVSFMVSDKVEVILNVGV